MSTFRFVQVPAAPTTLAEGRWELAWHADWANYFTSDAATYLLDYEAVRARFSGAYGLSARTQIGFSTSATYQGAGALDAFIEGFERAIGAVNHERRAAPRDRYLIRLTYPDGSVRESRGGDAGWVGDHATVTLTHAFRSGDTARPAVAGTVSLKLPGRGDRAGRPQGGVDAGAGIGVAHRLGRLNVYGSASVVRFGDSDTPGRTLRFTQASLMLAGEYRASARTSLVLQATIASPVTRDAGEFAERSHEVAIGCKRLLSPALLLEASIEENLFVFGNSADVAFHAGLTWRPMPPAR